jgi:hypothetical protein
VVSRLPLFVEQNINAEAPLGQAHYTKNDSHALKKVLKVRRWRLNIKVKERPFTEGSRDLTCARAFSFVKHRYKFILRGGCFLSTTGNGFLLSSILNKWVWFRVLWKFGTLVLFYKALALLPTFSFLKPWLTDSIGCPPTFTYHEGVPFFSFLDLDYNGPTSSLTKLMTSRWSMQVEGYLI